MRQSVPTSAGWAIGAVSYSWAGIVHRTFQLPHELSHFPACEQKKEKKSQIKQECGIAPGCGMEYFIWKLKTVSRRHIVMLFPL